MHLLRIWWVKFPCWESLLRSLLSPQQKSGHWIEMCRLYYRNTHKRQCSFVKCTHNCKSLALENQKTHKKYWWAGFTYLWRGTFCFGGDKEIDHFAQGFAVVLQQRQQLRGWISRFPATYPSPRDAFLNCSLLLQNMQHSALISLLHLGIQEHMWGRTLDKTEGAGMLQRHHSSTVCYGTAWPRFSKWQKSCWQSGQSSSYKSQISIWGWWHYGWSEAHYRFQSCW